MRLLITMKYAHLSPDYLKDVLDKCHTVPHPLHGLDSIESKGKKKPALRWFFTKEGINLAC